MLAALTAWLYGVALREWPRDLQLRLLAILGGAAEVARLPADEPATHLLLAAQLEQFAALQGDSTRSWLAAMWRRSGSAIEACWRWREMHRRAAWSRPAARSGWAKSLLAGTLPARGEPIEITRLRRRLPRQPLPCRGARVSYRAASVLRGSMQPSAFASGCRPEKGFHVVSLLLCHVASPGCRRVQPGDAW